MKTLAIASGKGGVGKSTTTIHLALALQLSGAKVGILDADLYGPSMKKMLGVAKGLEEKGQKIIPAEGLGIKYVSLSLIPQGQSPVTVRAPIANHLITQFIDCVEWGDLDYLFVDFPPGTGDIQLTLLQKMQFNGAVLVSTPQQVSLIDVDKAYGMFLKMGVRVLGVVENMSFLKVEDKRMYPYGRGNVQAFCKERSIEYLGEIPIDEWISSSCDRAESLFVKDPGSIGSVAFINIQKKIKESLFDKIKETHAILKIEKIDPQHFSITWNDQKKSVYHIGQLQYHCPCKRCKDRLEKKRDENVSFSSIKEVGNYAISLDFSSGCKAGIYTFDLLRNLEKC